MYDDTLQPKGVTASMKEDTFAGLSMTQQRMVMDLADLVESRVTDEQMLYLCPDDYPETIGDEHRNSVWSMLVDFFSELDPNELYACWASFLKDGHDTTQLIAHIMVQHDKSFDDMARG